MSDGSVAPKERINVKFVPATGDQQEEIELPLKTVILGDFTGRPDDSPIEERKAIDIDKNSFPQVMREMGLSRTVEVKDVIGDDPEANITATIDFESLQDFSPDAIVQKVPQLKQLSDLREALTALKGPLGNMPAFRKALGEIVSDPDKREALLSEIESMTSTDH